MSSTTAPAHLATWPAPGPGGGLARLARETWILTRRSLTRIRNEPETLSDVTIQPVMFTLLFAYVFGSAIHLGGPFGGAAAYHEYLIAGLFGLTVIGTLAGTAVPTTGTPAWLQAFANWNPVSAAAASCRNLFGNPNPASSIDAWPMQHPEAYTVLWAIGVVLVFAPVAVYLYRRRSRS